MLYPARISSLSPKSEVSAANPAALQETSDFRLRSPSVHGRRNHQSPNQTKSRFPGGLDVKLCRKAKEQKRYRFYSLYDKIIDKETLTAAYRKARANDGAPGTDGVTFVRIDEVIGEERFVDELHGELTAGRYKASPVRRVYIPKANGKLRPLGIPVIQDRVVQEAVLLIIEPIFCAPSTTLILKHFMSLSWGIESK